MIPRWQARDLALFKETDGIAQQTSHIELFLRSADARMLGGAMEHENVVGKGLITEMAIEGGKLYSTYTSWILRRIKPFNAHRLPILTNVMSFELAKNVWYTNLWLFTPPYVSSGSWLDDTRRKNQAPSREDVPMKTVQVTAQNRRL